MNDLLHGLENSGKSPEKSGSRVPEVSVSLKGKGTSGRAGVPLPGSPGTSDGGPFTQHKGNVRSKSELREDARHLIYEIETAEVVRAAAEEAQAPFKSAFAAADQALINLFEARQQGRRVDKATILKGYDRRLSAGHVWDPHRKHLQHTTRWLKALRTELTEINKEIG